MKKRFALILALLMMVSLLPGMAQALALAWRQVKSGSV